MKKRITFLIFSFFLGMLNAAAMPIQWNEFESSLMQVSSQDHCHGTLTPHGLENDAADSQSYGSHYCCSVAAVLNAAFPFHLHRQADIFQNAMVYVPPSADSNSIYRPPKTNL